jgi:hypothetical protein
MPAHRTGTARIARVNEDDADARTSRLVDDERGQLEKGPTPELPSHLAAETVGSVSDSRQVFETQCLARGTCRLHKLLADNVIDVLAEARRLAAYLLEGALGSLGTLLRCRSLQTRSVGTDAAAHGLNGLARVRAALAISGEFHDAEVNSKNAVCDDQRRVGDAHRRHQVELTSDKGKVGLALTERQQPALILPAHKGQFQPAVNRPKAYLPFVHIPRQDTVIKGYRAHRLKCALSALVQFVGVRNLADAPNHHLRGQARLGPLDSVLGLMQRVLAEGLVLPGPRADSVTGGVRRLHGALQGVRLVGRHDQFHLCGKFQSIDIIPRIYTEVNTYTKGCRRAFGRFNLPLGRQEGIPLMAKATSLLP